MAKRWQRVLAGDIGGTKTWLVLDAVHADGSLERVAEAKIPSAEHGSLESAIEAFLDESGEELGDLRAAAFGIAGPVRDGKVKTTNLPWVVDGSALARSLDVPTVGLLNDFDAIAVGIGELGDGQLVELKAGEVDPNGPRLIVGAGTGLGVAGTLPDGRILESEGGHLAFAPRDELEEVLLSWLRAQVGGRVSVERVVSGPGLVDLYRFLVEAGRAETAPAVRAAVAAEGAAAISAHADTDPAAKLALERFIEAYGAAAGELALALIPTGGLYVAGGIAPRLHHDLGPRFAEIFVRGLLPKGRMAPLLEATRVVLVDEPRVGLLGARRRALDLLATAEA